MSKFQPTYDELEQIARKQLSITRSIYNSIACEHTLNLIEKLRFLEAENANLKAEAEIWKERVQMRQELVEQYERDIAELKRELRAALERS